MDGYFSSYALVGGMIMVGALMVSTAWGGSRLLRPERPTPQKLLGYECGVDPVEGGWAQSYVRYYVFTFLYVIFAVDAVFLFPWATVFAEPGYGAATLVEMLVFVAVVAVGVLYAWRKGVLRWV